MDNCYLCKSKYVETVVDRKDLGVWAINLGQFFPIPQEKMGSSGVDYLVEDFLSLSFQLLHYYHFSTLVFLAI